MRKVWPVLVCLGWLACVAAVAYARADCSGRLLVDAKGQPVGLTDCQLSDRIEKAQLREHLGECVQALEGADRRVYGSMRFELDMHSGGGASAVRFPRSAFDRTGFPDCVSRVIRRRLAGSREGKPFSLQGRMRLEPGRAEDFAFSLSGLLAPPVRKRLAGLPGSFARWPDGARASCELGGVQINLVLDPSRRVALPDWPAPSVSDARVDACLALAEPEPEAKPKRKAKKKPRRSTRSIRRQVTSCLVKLLGASDWAGRAAAAEELAGGWRWRGRRALKERVEEALTEASCLERLLAYRKGRAEAGGEEPHCSLVAPKGAAAGHALVRMLKAQLRLRRQPRPGVIGALAAHPDASVRGRLLDTILARWKRGIPEGLHSLIRDSDPQLRARAQQVGCERADWKSLHAFRFDLASPDVRIRATAMKFARACVIRARDEVEAAAASEPNPALAILMLRAIPVRSKELLFEKAAAGLFDPCPVVRYLSARLLFRLEQVPTELLRQALERERDPLLKAQLNELRSPPGQPASARVEQIWIKTARDPG
jgi:hypothetical protein